MTEREIMNVGKILLLGICMLTPFPQAEARRQATIDWESLPLRIPSGQQERFHAQGIAFDAERQCVYISFTTKLIKVDLQGRVVGSVVGLTGHLGCMAMNPDDGRLYASIEYKHDAIGKGIMNGLGGVENDTQDAFYIAVFDVERINRLDMDASEVMRTVYIREAVEDYKAVVTNQGRNVEHRFGCSGIDGVAVGPQIGRKGGRNMLYVAYGIYGDKERTDNDYQVILCYDLRRWKRYESVLSPTSLHHNGPDSPQAKYFVRTGNTEWGIQNLAYDPFRRALLAAVYPGRKQGWPNYSLFAIDAKSKASREILQGVEPETKGLVLRLQRDGIHDAATDVWGWRFGWGSTGLCPLGNGYYYISENARDEASGRESTMVTLYRWDGKNPFSRAERK